MLVCVPLGDVQSLSQICKVAGQSAPVLDGHFIVYTTPCANSSYIPSHMSNPQTSKA